ncbi:flagellar hook assembly protein FlgD [Roseateles koreensis]|uniref:Basal-body rod modification protein FlgD n=1 Tax=Roseateles koreensis TaxID=2987526 RepID=A0ABT5KN09_9BURK|nr:flagellar hook capping FlgD N-terminal domain-containing protein [Roseateles koreensis]MDC8784294.1 flagellar hook capping FlgD N-terminal domain-containing protein [Roseateles koreensis]
MDFTTLNTTTSKTGTAATATSTSSGTGTTTTAADTQDRFLKLLVAQMKNQDPMNPMDNAQVTSQMAQIQTVSGISTLDTTMKSLGSQFNQMQALQSVSLVGRTVSFAGNQLNLSSGAGKGSYDLSSSANAVKLDVLNSAGVVVDTQQLGAEGKGRQNFTWTPPSTLDTTAAYTFRITATNGSAPVTSTTYAQDKVVAVNTSGTTLQLELQNAGLTDYSKVSTVD